MPCPRHSSAAKTSTQPGNPRRQLLGRRLQSIEEQATGLSNISLAKRIEQGLQRSGRGGGAADAIHGGSRQAFRRSHDHKVQQTQPWCRFDPLTAAAANGRTAVEEKRHVAAQFRRQCGEVRKRQAKFPTNVRGDQGCGCIAGATAQTRGGGNPLHQPQPRALFCSRPPADQVHRSQDEISAVARHVFKTTAVTGAPACGSPVPGHRTRPAFQFQFFTRCSFEAQGIVPADRAHERFNLMVTVAALSQHLEEQVELRRRMDHDLHRTPVDPHV